ncbi:MAG: ethanolamine utilization protein EutH [Lachnospiraceae bacterium]|nr:ethanolamine utilization protein EutH [Lachnospiraceae bacterium]
MNTYQIIKGIMAIGVLIGGIDYLFNKHHSVGEKFESGFTIAGQMFLSMIGIMSIAPVLANILKPLIVPGFQFFNVDPAVLGMFLSIDMGGYHLAMSLADASEVGKMIGLITSSMFGGTLIFTIPVAAGLIEKDKLPLFNRGLLYGLISIPIGSIIGGLLLGIGLREVIINNIPVIFLSFLVVLGFRFHPKQTLKIFDGLGFLLTKVGIISIILGFVSYLIEVPFISGLIPITQSMEIVCSMIIFLVGSLPIIEIITKILKKPLSVIGKKFQFKVADMSGLLITMASSVPMIASVDKMSNRGIIINGTWTVAISAILGSQMSFVLGIEPTCIVPFMVSKVITGITSLFIALYYTREEKSAEIEL